MSFEDNEILCKVTNKKVFYVQKSSKIMIIASKFLRKDDDSTVLTLK